MLDKTKKYRFKKELLLKDLKARNQPEEIGQWASIVDNREVVLVEDGKRAKWQGNVKYTVGVNHFNQPVQQVTPEVFYMEPEWLEEIETENNTNNNE